MAPVSVWTKSEILGGLVTLNYRHVTQNPNIESHHHVDTCADKDRSAWTEVWTGTCRSSKRFWFPEVVVLDRFSRFLRFWAVLGI